MKIVKPQKCGLLTRTFEREGEFFLAVTPLVFFELGAAPAVLTEVDMWKTVAHELGDQVLDQAMPKLRGEVVVWGRAYPAQPPKPTAVVHVHMGAVDKTLYVIGDRTWHRGVPTDPVPFGEMPVTWTRAFGGEGYGLNPTGKGFVDAGKDGCALPNVEDPRHLLRSPRDRPAPAGLAGQDMMWPERRKLLGTYGKKWLETRYPGFPEDMQWSAMNLAPDDQQIQGFFRGDEAFSVDGMHPTRARVEGRLPGVSTRAFVVAKGSDAPTEVTTRLDTVWLLPHLERGVLVFRGLTRVAEDDAHDVAVVLAALETMGAPREAGYYREALEKRKDKQKAAILALSDKDLVPEGLAKPTAGAKVDDGLKSEGHMRKRMRKRMEAERQKMIDQLTAQGVDLSKVEIPPLPPEPKEPSTDPEDLEKTIEEAKSTAEKAKVEAEAKKAEAEAAAREACKAQGIDFDKATADAKAKGGGPPKFSAKDQMDKLRELAALAGPQPPAEMTAMLADPSLEQRLKDAEGRMRDAYKRFAHMFPPAQPLDPDAARKLRDEVTAAHGRGEALANRDLTGADLSGVNLTGADLRGAMMEGANLSGAQLGGAKLSGAVLARADLTNANLFAAKLDGANLGAATLVNAELGETDLTGATLGKANLMGARLRNARMDKVDLMECLPARSDWSGVAAPGVIFLKLDMTAMKLAGAELTKAILLECVMDDLDASGATLTKAAFVKPRGERVSLREAVLDGACFNEASLPGVDLQGASLDKTNLRGSKLSGANLERARMSGADLSECDLRDANFYRAQARGARMDRADLTGARMVAADLMEGSLAKARLHGADLRGANLFRADLARVHLDGATQVTDAHLVRARMLPGNRSKEA